jgi:hypothetical protein
MWRNEGRPITATFAKIRVLTLSQPRDREIGGIPQSRQIVPLLRRRIPIIRPFTAQALGIDGTR